MKYDTEMQDVPNQSSQVQAGAADTPDHGIKRNRSSDSSNNSTKVAPEVIDLDEEDTPKENEEAPLALNGVTTVRKVSLPWQRTMNLNSVDKKPCESSVESTSAECPTSERGAISSEQLSAPAEADEALPNKANEGERKRPSHSGGEESDPKRSKIDNGAKAKVPSAKAKPKESEGKESPKPIPRDSTEVSVVDLVEDDDEQDKVIKNKEQDKSVSRDGPEKVDGQAIAMPPRKSDSPVPHGEKKTHLSVPPLASTQGLLSVQSPGSVSSPNVPSEEKRTSLSSIISSGKNGLITQMQSIEVKKVKLCPQLEKQATAMSAAASLPLTPAVATPKPSTGTPKSSTGASLAQIPVSITASTPETSEIPSSASSKPLESAKEVVKEEAVLLGADLEKKKGLNPVHSETRKRVKKLTRAELESFFLELACEMIISKSEAGRYRQLYEEMKESCENKANKIAQLSKQLMDLSVVVHRAINDSKEKRDTIPPKITRSVGLQLEHTQILNAWKKPREDRGFVTPPASTSSSLNSSASTSDRIQSAKFARASSFSVSRTTPPSTPNGLIAVAGVKDTPSCALVPVKSPQRQLRALHPRVPSSAAHVGVQLPSGTSSTASALSTPDPAPKRLGFIDIADDKIINSGAHIGVRRHRSPAMIVTTTPGNSVNPCAALSTLSSSQAMAPALKVVSSPYAHPATISGNNYPQPGNNTRVVAATAIPVASGASISSPRLTYIIPASGSLAVQPRQLVLTSPTQSQQIRGRSPVTSMPAMLMRQSTTLVQVPSGSITTTPPTLIRAVQPSAAQQQVLATSKTSQQQQPPRLVGMTSRPSPAASSKVVTVQHPAPLPAQPQPTVVNSNLKPIPRRPVLKLSKVPNGIVLSWNMTATTPHEEIASYQLYAYQEGANAPPSPSLWKKVGDVKALPLPMACTLTQFADGHTYHFAVRAVDVHGRVGEFSVPGTIELFS